MRDFARRFHFPNCGILAVGLSRNDAVVQPVDISHLPPALVTESVVTLMGR
jgi:hypothetical protein